MKYISITGYKNVRKAIWVKFDGHCVYCCNEISVNDFHIEHEVPISRGGKNTYGNIFPSCKKCNLKKRDRTPEEAGMDNHWRYIFRDDGSRKPDHCEEV